MEYSDRNEYEKRIEVVHEILTTNPKLPKKLTDEDRQDIQTYFIAAYNAKDKAEFRRDCLKANPTVELQANKAYERLLAEAGIPESLPQIK